MLDSRADAEAILQEAYIRWIESNTSELRSAEAWLVTIVTRLCIDRLRSAAVRPEVVIHQLTDLPAALESNGMAEGIARTTRIRKEGTQNLVAAALESGARRLIAQSLACWVYADGPQPYSENAPLDLRSDGPYAIVVEGIVALERLTTASPPLEGVVLRYGQIYGPGTGFDEATGWAPLHVDAAAHAALLAIERGKPGIFNIAEETGYVSIGKARRELDWDPGFHLRNRRTTARSEPS